jgi:predicted dehydrogenase
MISGMTRRQWLKATGLGAVVAPTMLTKATRASDRDKPIRIGIIGTGGRARNHLMPALKKLKGVRIDAVCDVFDLALRQGHFLAGGRKRSVFKTRDHRELLAREDIDAVVIATPDHWHVPLVIEACEAGKDVYVEKPLTHRLDEGQQVIDAKNRTGRVVQVGAQQRSMKHIAELRHRLQSGELDIGPIHWIQMRWNRNHTPYNKPKFNNLDKSMVDWDRWLGPAPKQPFDPFRMHRWRWIWDFGSGVLGDLMTHWLDAANWLLDLPQPGSVVSQGDHYIAEDIWETPDTQHAIFHYPQRKMQIDFFATFANDTGGTYMKLFSSNATIYVDRGRYEIASQPRSAVKAEKHIASPGELGQSFYREVDGDGRHLADWIEAIRQRREPVEPVEAGVQAAAAAHYGNQAYRQQQLVTIDA